MWVLLTPIFSSQSAWRCVSEDHVRLETYQFGGEMKKPIVPSLGKAIVYENVLSLYVAKLTQSLPEGFDTEGIGGARTGR